MSRAIIIGERAAILPFRAAGVELLPAATPEEARPLLRKLAHDLDDGVVFVPEAWAEACRDEFALLRRKPRVAATALAIPMPGAQAGVQREWVRELVRRAIGIDKLGPRTGEASSHA